MGVCMIKDLLKEIKKSSFSVIPVYLFIIALIIMKIVTFTYKNFSINFNSQMVFINECNIQLTMIEYKIIELLCKNAGKVLTYDYIQKCINGPYISESNSSLRVHMANIRRKIEENPSEPKYIVTHVGVGYRFNI